MFITIAYGTGNHTKKEFPSGETVGSILANPHVKETLRYGDAVEGHIGGVPQSDDYIVLADTVIVVQNKFCEKSGSIQFGKYKFFIKGHLDKSEGQQERQHVHVWLKTSDKSPKFWLDTGELAEATRVKPQIVSDIQRTIKQYRKELREALWTQPFSRLVFSGMP
jgi:hypothetical protein